MVAYFTRSKRWLLVGVIAMVGQVILMFIEEPGWIAFAAVALTLLVGTFVLRRSRLAWTIAALGAAGQIVEAMFASQPLGIAFFGGVVLVCLFAPASIRSVWGDSGGRARGASPARMLEKVHKPFYHALAIAAGWESTVSGEGRRRSSKSYKALIWRLGLSSLVLLLLVGLTYDWEQDTGGATLPSIAADIAWSSYAVIQLAFLVILVLAAVRRLTPDRVERE